MAKSAKNVLPLMQQVQIIIGLGALTGVILSRTVDSNWIFHAHPQIELGKGLSSRTPFRTGRTDRDIPSILPGTKKAARRPLLKMMSEVNPNYRPFFERRVPAVAPWRALNFGFDLQIT